MILIPTERTWRVFVHMRNRHVLTFTCADIDVGRIEGQLVRVDVTDQRRFPLWFSISDVVSIEHRREWRYRPFRRWEWCFWIAVNIAIFVWPRLI